MNVLVVEDDESLCELIQTFLELQGFKVITSCSLEKAYFFTENIDIVVMDSFYGEEFKFLKFCKNKNIYCIYHTGKVDITHEEYFAFDFVVQKPAFDSLINCVNNFSLKGDSYVRV